MTDVSSPAALLMDDNGKLSDYGCTMKADGTVGAISRRSTTSKPSQEALLRLIAEEMTKSLLGGDEEGEEEDDLLKNFNVQMAEQDAPRRPKRKNKPKRRSKSAIIEPEVSEAIGASNDARLAEVYYSHIAGDGIPETTAFAPEEDDFPDHSSFAGLHLDNLVENQKSRQSNHSRGSTNGTSTVSEESGSATNIGSFAGSGSEESRELSIDEIRKYVLQHIPQSLREQIPEESWQQIFRPENANGSNAGSRDPSGSAPSPVSEEAKPRNEDLPIGKIVIDGIPMSTEDEADDVDDDEVSAVSDITGLTDAFPDSFKFPSKRRSMAGTEVSDITSPTEFTDDSSTTMISQRTKDTPLKCPTRAPLHPSEIDPFGEGECVLDKPPLSQRSNRISPVVEESKTSHSRSMVSSQQSTASAQGSSSKPPRVIKFDQIEFRFYERILSDNPAVQSGPAIGIGWRFKRGGRIDVDEWELRKGPARKSADLVIPRHERERLMREVGYDQKEIAEMIRAIVKAKNQRKQTVTNLPASGLEEAVEAAKRKVSRLLSFGMKKDLIKQKS